MMIITKMIDDDGDNDDDSCNDDGDGCDACD